MHYSFDNQNNLINEVKKLSLRHGFDIEQALKKLSKKDLNLILMVIDISGSFARFT